MNASRLRSVVDLLITEYERLSIDSKLKQVSKALQESAANPSAANDESLSDAFNSLLDALDGSRTNDLVESSRRILENINGDSQTGVGLAAKIEAIMDERPFLASRAKEQVDEVTSESTSYMGSLKSAQSSLTALNVTSASLSDNQYELGILFPDAVTKNELGKLGQELTEWNQPLREVFEAVTAKPPRIEVRSVSSGSLEIFISLDPEGALAVAMLIGGLYAMIQKIRKNKDTAEELRKEGYPIGTVNKVAEYEATIRQDELKAIRTRVIDAYVGEETRKPEVEQLLEKGIQFIADKLDEGIQLEVSGPPVDDDEDVNSVEVVGGDIKKITHNVRAALRAAMKARRELESTDEASPAQLTSDTKDPAQDEVGDEEETVDS